MKLTTIGMLINLFKKRSKEEIFRDRFRSLCERMDVDSCAVYLEHSPEGIKIQLMGDIDSFTFRESQRAFDALSSLPRSGPNRKARRRIKIG